MAQSVVDIHRCFPYLAKTCLLSLTDWQNMLMLIGETEEMGGKDQYLLKLKVVGLNSNLYTCPKNQWSIDVDM